MIYRLLPFSLPKKKKNPPKPGGIEEEGEGRSAAGDRFSPERRESHPQSCEKMNHVFPIKTSHRFSGKLVIEDTIEMTVLFSSVAVSGGNSVNQSGGLKCKLNEDQRCVIWLLWAVFTFLEASTSA